MRRYELMLLLRPDLEDDKLQSAVEKVTRAVVNAGGSLAKVSPWGKRRLAYEIKDHRDASYFLIHFDIEPAEIRPLEQGLLISEDILRHLVTVIEERPADEAEAIKATPAAAPAEDGNAAAAPAERDAVSTPAATTVDEGQADASDASEAPEASDGSDDAGAASDREPAETPA